MGIFYKPSSYRNFSKFFRKKKFMTRNDGPHLIGVHPDDESIELSVPRHTTLANGTTEQLCKKLLDLGYSEEEIKKYILR